MAQVPGPVPTGPLFKPDITQAGLPHREDYILAREKNLFPQMVGALTRSRHEWNFEQAAASLTLPALEAGFASPETIPRIGAAFLAGRVLSPDPPAQARLPELLNKLIKSIKRDDYDVDGQPFVEAAFSLALLGDHATGEKLLKKFLKANEAFSPLYLAAYYLAQLGDPSGYPALLKCLHSHDEHTRMMASRYLLGFKPYDGQEVAGKVINLKEEYRKLLKDPGTYVKKDIPNLMKEAGLK